METTREIQRAEYLVGRLQNAIAIAKAFKTAKASLDLPVVEELVDLLADSIRTAKEFDLVEFDGTIEPESNRGNMIARPCLEDYRIGSEESSKLCRHGNNEETCERCLFAWQANFGGA